MEWESETPANLTERPREGAETRMSDKIEVLPTEDEDTVKGQSGGMELTDLN